MDCIFCKIINNEIPSTKLYEDDNIIVFLDIDPINTGHCLVVPKKHSSCLGDTPINVITDIFEVIKKITPKIKSVTGCDGITIVQNNGLLQEVKHIHFHIIPVYENEKVGIVFNHEGNLDNSIADKINL